jgi:hypothetical protein
MTSFERAAKAAVTNLATAYHAMLNAMLKEG